MLRWVRGRRWRDPFCLSILSVAGAFSAVADPPHPGPSPSTPAAEVVPLAPVTHLGPGVDDGSAAEQAILAKWLGEAVIAGIGESVHGTDTLHRLANRIFAHLAAEEGFTVFAWEIDQAHARLLDEYVQGSRDDLDALLESGWWGQKIFYDRALADLLRWMRRQNEAGRRRLHFAGFDAKQPRLAIAAILEALSAAEAGELGRLRALYDRAMAPGAFGVFPNVWGFTASVEIPLQACRGRSSLRVVTMARSAGLSRGSAGIAVYGSRPELGGYAALTPDDRSDGWRPLTVELTLPEGTESIVFELFHRGNGTVELEAPHLTCGEVRLPSPRPGDLAVRPLMSPANQVMDYHQEVVVGADGRVTLRITVDPGLDRGLADAQLAEGLVQSLLDRGPKEARGQAVWILRLARLVSQAVQWRSLAETNRDVFLAENLRWLAEVAFPGARIVAFAHTSHTELRRDKMGGILAASSGRGYRAVSLFAASGEYLYFGDVATLAPDAPLERFAIEPRDAGPLQQALSRLGDGSFMARLAGLADTAAGRRWLSEVDLSPDQLPDIAVLVERVDPILPPLSHPAAR